MCFEWLIRALLRRAYAPGSFHSSRARQCFTNRNKVFRDVIAHPGNTFIGFRVAQTCKFPATANKMLSRYFFPEFLDKTFIRIRGGRIIKNRWEFSSVEFRSVTLPDKQDFKSCRREIGF